MGAGQNLAASTVVSIVVAAALLVAVLLILFKGDHTSPDTVDSTTSKMFAVNEFCQTTRYTDTCKRSLSRTNTTDHFELTKDELKAAVKGIEAVLNKSITLQKAAKDPSISESYKICQELLVDSLDDLHRTIDKFEHFDVNKLDIYLSDLKTWLGGALTCQDTCIDGFEGTKGDAGENMKKLLETTRELTINGLTLVNEYSKLAAEANQFRLGRNLLSKAPKRYKDEYPAWIDDQKRKLLSLKVAEIKPDVVVAKDGSGRFKTINEALKAVPVKSRKTFVIYIKEGVYQEYVHVTKQMRNVMFIGDGPTKTKITGNKSFGTGFKTWSTATVSVDGFFFTAKDIGIENSAGSKGHQAVALRSSSDMSIFYNCRIDGYQDTLYVHSHRQFYRDCTISGTIDFIFGDAVVLFQNCKMIIRKPGSDQSCMVTAQGRTADGFPSGIVLQNCSITGAPDLLSATPRIKSFLGRPWKNHSRTVVLNSQIDSVIDPKGWAPWAGDSSLSTCWYAEYGNKGAGARKTARVTWPGIKKINSTQEVLRFAPSKFILGNEWIPQSGVPYQSGL